MDAPVAYCRRTRGIRPGVLFGVIFAHGLALCGLSSNTASYRPSWETRSLSAILILTNNPTRASTELPPLVGNAVVLQDPREPVMSLPALPVIRYAEPNPQAVSIAPQLLDARPPDAQPFAHRAGLLPGESAVVVLRVEVLTDGHVGEVQIDVSSGSDRLDEAAMDYARLLMWVPGRANGIEESTWVRYSVQLAA